jgi:hypothetical protein
LPPFPLPCIHLILFVPFSLIRTDSNRPLTSSMVRGADLR